MKKNKIVEEYLAVAFLSGSDRARFGCLLDRLQNDYLQGNNAYPRTLSSAYHLLTNWKSETSSNDISQAAVFVTTEVNTPRRTNKNNNNTVTCFNFGCTGHYANNCPNSITPRERNVMPRAIEQEEVGTLASCRNTTTDASTMLTSGSKVIPTTSVFVFCSQSIVDIGNINNTNGTGNHIQKSGSCWIISQQLTHSQMRCC
jgi:hypothetical protein